MATHETGVEEVYDAREEQGVGEGEGECGGGWRGGPLGGDGDEYGEGREHRRAHGVEGGKPSSQAGTVVDGDVIGRTRADADDTRAERDRRARGSDGALTVDRRGERTHTVGAGAGAGEAERRSMCAAGAAVTLGEPGVKVGTREGVVLDNEKGIQAESCETSEASEASEASASGRHPGGGKRDRARARAGAPKVELQDQTNLLPFKQVLIVFLGLSMALFACMLDQTM